MLLLSLVELGFVAVLLFLIGGRSRFVLCSDDLSSDGFKDASDGEGDSR